jgi:hypothetical protein
MQTLPIASVEAYPMVLPVMRVVLNAVPSLETVTSNKQLALDGSG